MGVKSLCAKVTYSAAEFETVKPSEGRLACVLCHVGLVAVGVNLC